MKKLIFVFLLLAIASTVSLAQSGFTFGLKGGMSTSDIDPVKAGSLILKGQGDSLGLSINKANYGYHFGVFGRFQTGGFFVQPEVVFNSTKVDFNVKDFTPIGMVNGISSASYQNVDIPLMIGMKYFHFLRLSAGPVAHIHFSSSSDLTAFSGYADKFKNATYGYQAGIGVDVWHLGIDLRYEGNFSNYGNQITFAGNTYQFATTPSRMIGSVSWAF